MHLFTTIDCFMTMKTSVWQNRVKITGGRSAQKCDNPLCTDSCLKDPFEFKKVLEDDMLRRMFILDADVTVHSTDLATKMPCLDSASRLEVLHNGGKRRVDKILTHKLHRVKVLGYAFLTTLTNLTDHLPVVMTFQHSNCSVILTNRDSRGIKAEKV
uniref:Uncharacterized protein n=1 Tax=Timema poppense TaxID=170557 RepID=A0A7R9CLD7_TIMPO|nr:unnamed protein product [Timema poppensis]